MPVLQQWAWFETTRQSGPGENSIAQTQEVWQLYPNAPWLSYIPCQDFESQVSSRRRRNCPARQSSLTKSWDPLACPPKFAVPQVNNHYKSDKKSDPKENGVCLGVCKMQTAGQKQPKHSLQTSQVHTASCMHVQFGRCTRRAATVKHA